MNNPTSYHRTCNSHPFSGFVNILGICFTSISAVSVGGHILKGDVKKIGEINQALNNELMSGTVELQPQVPRYLVDPGWLFHTGNPKILRWLKEKAITSLGGRFFLEVLIPASTKWPATS